MLLTHRSSKARFTISVLALTAAVACSDASPPPPSGGSDGPPALDLATRPAVDGITRTTLRDDAQMTVTRVHFAPGAAEPVHTHPFDIMVVPLQSGSVDLVLGEETIRGLGLGDVQFVPSGVSHQLANVGEVPFELIAIALK